MSIKNDYPLKFNDTELYYPKTFNIDEDVVENVNQTEAGTDQIQLVRVGKVKISITTECVIDVFNIFKEFSIKPSFTVSYYDPSVDGYTTKTVRMRSFKYAPSDLSYELEDACVYSVSFTLEEF